MYAYCVVIFIHKKDFSGDWKSPHNYCNVHCYIFFQVFEEKRQNWEVDLHDIREDSEQRLKQQQQKAFRTEQGLLMKIFQLQQDKKTVEADVTSLKTHLDVLQDKLQKQHDESVELSMTHHDQVEALKWDCDKKAERLSELNHQVEDSQAHIHCLNEKLEGQQQQYETELERVQQMLENSMSENTSLHADVNRLIQQQQQRELQEQQQQQRELQEQLHQEQLKDQMIEKSQQTDERAEVLDLHDQVEGIRRELLHYKTRYEDERNRWLAEKDKVLKYQKHLQLNYKQMHNKNMRLESDIQQLMMDLENTYAENFDGDEANKPVASSTLKKSSSLPPPSPPHLVASPPSPPHSISSHPVKNHRKENLLILPNKPFPRKLPNKMFTSQKDHLLPQKTIHLTMC